MITKNDIDKILVDVNRILANFEERISSLESAKAKPTTTTTRKSQEKA